MSNWGTVKGGCPQCGGDAKWYEYGADCRGNPGSEGVSCLAGCEWTEEQKQAFWSDLFAKQREDWKKSCEKRA